MEIPLEKLGLSAGERYIIRDLWSRQETEADGGVIRVSLIPAQSTILRITKG